MFYVPNMFSRVFEVKTSDQKSPRTNQRVIDDNPTSGLQVAQGSNFCSLIKQVRLTYFFLNRSKCGLHRVHNAYSIVSEVIFSKKSCGNCSAYGTCSPTNIFKMTFKIDMS